MKLEAVLTSIMSRYGNSKRAKRSSGRRGGGIGSLWKKLAPYFNPSMQYSVTIISAIALAGFLFSGYLLFQYADTEDLLARGKRLMVEGKVALAAKTFQQLVFKHKNSYEGHLLLGKAYLELDDRKKAEQEFRTAASLKSGKDLHDSAADIAMSKLAVAKKEYPVAEEMLLKALGNAKKGLGPDNRAKTEAQYRDIMDIRQSLFELYETWGDDIAETGKLAATKTHYPDLIAKYERALRYVNDYRNEDELKEKLIECYNFYAGYLADQNEDEKSILLMKKSLRYRYLPETLIEIAAAYERIKKLDDAIEWYRKAFDANPSTISIRLTKVLIDKAHLLMDEKKQEEARRYFDEADQVSKRANLPLDVLYPVKVSELQVISSLDEETGEFEPKVKIRLENAGERTLNFLAVKVDVMSEDEQISQMMDVVASPDTPLYAKADLDTLPSKPTKSKASKPSSKASITLKPEEKLNVHMFKRGQFKIVVSIAYSEGNDQVWKVKAIQEAAIQRKKPAPEPAADTQLPPA